MTFRVLLVRAAAVAALSILSGHLAEAATDSVSRDVALLPLRRPIEGVSGSARIVVEEDSLLAAATAEDFKDLRLMDDTGASVPFERVETQVTEESITTWKSLPVRWIAGADGSREMVFDLGADPPDQLWLTARGVGGALQVMGTTDGTTWVYLAHAAEGWSIQPAQTGSRIRLLQEGIEAPDVDASIDLVQRSQAHTPREIVGHTSGQRFISDNNWWEAEITLTGPPRTLVRVDLKLPRRPAPERSHTVEARLPEGGWQHVALQYTPKWEGDVDSLVFSPIRTSALRIRLSDGDPPNAPVEVLDVQATPEAWTFEAQEGRRYWFGYGDPYLESLGHAYSSNLSDAGEEAVVAILGDQEPNPFYRKPGFGLEWLKRRPLILSIFMIAILAAVALVARGGARKEPAAG